jgi:hypothetical protein
MVLENATNSDTFAPEPLPSSDLDPYEASSSRPSASGKYLVIPQSRPSDGTRAEPLYIDLGTLPQAVQSQSARRTIQDICQTAARLVDRPVTQQEAEAFAEIHARAAQVTSYGGPIGLGLGAIHTYRTSKEGKFPFWSPFKEGNRFGLNVNSLGPLKGFPARVLWHTNRFFAYAFLWGIGATGFMASYATSTSVARRMTDPRLKDVNQALIRKMKDGTARQASDNRLGKVGNVEAGPKGGESYDMARQRRAAQDLYGRRAERGGADDASPTGGAFRDEFLEQAQPDGFLSEDEVRQRADARLSADRGEDRSQQASRTDTRPSSGSLDDLDGASSRQSPPKQPGSAWERLRRAAMTGKSQTSRPSPREGGEFDDGDSERRWP